MQDQVKEIRDILKEVKYPGTVKNIVELDMVQHIKIEDGKVAFRLVFQNSNDPFVSGIKKKCASLLTAYGEVEIETIFMHDLERPLSLEKVKQKTVQIVVCVPRCCSWVHFIIPSAHFTRTFFPHILASK